MESETILEEIAEQQGWDEKSQLELCLQYIQNQCDPATWRAFLEEQSATENSDESWKLSLHQGDEITIDTGDNELPPSIIIQTIEYSGDTVKIIDKEGQFHECLLKEIK